MRILLVLQILGCVSVSSAITCDALLELPVNVKFSLGLVKTMTPKDIIQCVAHLGKEELSKDAAEFIWHTLVTHYEGIANIPKNVLMNLHWVTTAVMPEDYDNITLNNIDLVNNFGLNYNLNEEQLKALAARIREDYAGKEPEDYTYYDLIALNQILCAFNRSEIERIHPVAYRETALTIGKLENCNPDVMRGFATLAMENNAFGSLENWNENIMKLLGKVTEYVPKEFLESKKKKTNVESSRLVN